MNNDSSSQMKYFVIGQGHKDTLPLKRFEPGARDFPMPDLGPMISSIPIKK